MNDFEYVVDGKTVYNHASGMEKLVAQLERQIFRDFRVIFVDDGSRDGTLPTLRDLAA